MVANEGDTMNCDSCNNFCTDLCTTCKRIVNGEIAFTNYSDDSTPMPQRKEADAVKADSVEKEYETAISVEKSQDEAKHAKTSKKKSTMQKLVEKSIAVPKSEPISSDEFGLYDDNDFQIPSETSAQPKPPVSFDEAWKPREAAKETEDASEVETEKDVGKEAETSEQTEPKQLEYIFGNGTIFNESCTDTMEKHLSEKSIDIVLTSPPYCTSNRAGKKSTATLKTETHSNPKYYPSLRYDMYNDNLSVEEYIEWSIKLFKLFDRILKKDGCVLYNISYSSTRRDMLFLTVAAILEHSNFSLADMIGWKKKSALPNNTSPNKLTRIFEPVFVFARKNEIETFACNKKVVSVREKTGQKMYENVFNFIDAANNDGACKLNKATYSSELCEKLLGIYGKAGMSIYDPFMGTGTTAVACKRLGMTCYGSEISKDQCAYAINRIENDSVETRL